jgi:deoxyribodipyrimidine photo-lyase
MTPEFDDIHANRIRLLNDAEENGGGKYVLYWMQAGQRTRHNPALEVAVREADRLKLPLLVCFGLTDGYPEANARHYTFLLQGLRDAAANLEKRGIKFVCRRGEPAKVAGRLAKDAALVVVDMSYTRVPRRWLDEAADDFRVPLMRVEGEVIVPVETASDKREYAARTIRPKLHKMWPTFLKGFEESKPKRDSLGIDVKGDVDVSDPVAALATLKVDDGVPPSARFPGGEDAAAKLMNRFLAMLDGYDTGRNQPGGGHHSYLSPYLHFGHISPVAACLAVRDSKKGTADDRDAFVEELGVRRELAKNFVWFSPGDYDTYACLPDWAKKTLAEHEHDNREYVYTRDQLENAETHDEYWNAAMREMTQTGFMTNYMRMYWGKKILEWTNTPESGYDTTLHLNNKHFLDGRDPNSYSNVAWIYGVHDRPWTERPIFGKTRYMNANGLKRKFDMAEYVAFVDGLGEAEPIL